MNMNGLNQVPKVGSFTRVPSLRGLMASAHRADWQLPARSSLTATNFDLSFRRRQ